MGHTEVQYRGLWDIERCNIVFFLALNIAGCLTNMRGFC